MWHSGIDQHKPYCVITTYGAEGPRVKQARVVSTPVALEKFNAADVTALDELYQLHAACHAAQLHLLAEQITTLERALYPYLIPDADVQRLLWIPGLGKR